MLGVQTAGSAVSGDEARRGEVRSGLAGRWGFGHVPALDGARGAAVVGVLLYHAGYLDGGYLGVDLFFVLSGYLITSLLLSEHAATGRIDLAAFWARRARRLLPAMLLVLGVVAGYAVLFARPVDFGAIRRDGLATLLYTANWRTILAGDSYWDISRAPSPLQHTWSLAIEEQFYLLWPLVVVGIARLARGRMVTVLRTVCLVGAAVSAALFVGLGLVASENRVYLGTDTRAAALLLGAGWAAWRMHRGTRPGGVAQPGANGEQDRGRGGIRRDGVVPSGANGQHGGGRGGVGVEVLGLVSVVGLAVAWVGLQGESDLLFRGGLPLCSLAATGLVVAITAPHPSRWLGVALSWRPLRAIGLISYGLYLWHWPIYVLFRPGRAGLHGLPLLAVRLGLSLAAAVVSYRLLEMPIRRGALRPRVARLSLAGGMALAAVAVVIATVGAISPVTDRVVASEVVPGAPRVMFVGDSVGLSVANHVAGAPRDHGVNPANHATIGCTVMADYTTRQNDTEVQLIGCSQYVPEWLERERPDLVVVLFGAGPVFDIQLDGRWISPCDPVFDRELAQTYRRYAEQVGSTGAQVVVVTAPLRDPETDPFHNPQTNVAIGCQNDALAEVVADVPGTHLLDINELVCPGGTCVQELAGDPLRSDGLHFDAGPGGARVARWITERSLSMAGLAPET